MSYAGSDGAIVSDAVIKPLKMVVLQPTKICNLDCLYCYLPNRRTPGSMSEAVIAATCKNIASSRYFEKEIKVCLHAGEPLAAGPDWFRSCLRIFGEGLPEGVHVDWSVQTNATLISNEWIDLFVENCVDVGISLDGPRDIHDGTRKNWSGEGSFDKAIAGAKKLQDNAIPFSILSVLNPSSFSRADEIFHFFRNLNPTEVAFNVEEREAANLGGSLDFLEAKEHSRKFFRRYWDLAEQHGFPHEVREFRHVGSVVAGVLAGQRLFNEMTEPASCITVATNGDFCTFAPELLEPGSAGADERIAIIGNVLDDTFDDALESSRFQHLHQEISVGVAQCEANCFYFPFCGGGSPSNKLFELGSFRGTETFYCRNGVQAVVDEALLRLSTHLTEQQMPRLETDLSEAIS